jgi:hypothetical protein
VDWRVGGFRSEREREREREFIDSTTLPSLLGSVGRYCHKLRETRRQRDREILRDPGLNPLLLGLCCMVLPQIERGRERERDPVESNFFFPDVLL